MDTETKSTISERLDALYEFDREPVTENKLHGIGNFIGMYAGEHVAGTEFIIGPLFVTHGATATAIFLGFFIGNVLAVLSWMFLCAPIAVSTRLTLYWQLRKICGTHLTFIYSIVNALAFCFLAGAMIAVSATAVGLPFNMPMPGLEDMYPTSVSWVVVVFCVGAVVTVLAILGFEKFSHFSKVCSPWMFVVFVAAGLAVLPKLGCTSVGDFWHIANEKIWTGVPIAGQSKFTIWHCIFFAWFANMAMHIGMADMSILRYARKWYYGYASAFGMFLGHFVAWICSGILCAAASGSVAPGPIAYMGAGVAGAVCVVIAGWTTANPTLYRAGLALQVATPNWKRWKVTLVAGLITTVAACFPALAMKLLEFVALYGLILMPMGAVIFADFWLLPKLGLKSNYAEMTGSRFTWQAGLTWALTLGAALYLNHLKLEIFFIGLPGWFIAVVLYVVLSAIFQKRNNITAPEAQNA
ncbi:purine-cytosine permease family protein [Candidatus Latescibacterota bacterium]